MVVAWYFVPIRSGMSITELIARFCAPTYQAMLTRMNCCRFSRHSAASGTFGSWLIPKRNHIEESLLWLSHAAKPLTMLWMTWGSFLSALNWILNFFFDQFRRHQQFQVVMTERQENPVDCATSKEQGESKTLCIRNVPENSTDQDIDVSFFRISCATDAIIVMEMFTELVQEIRKDWERHDDLWFRICPFWAAIKCQSG